MELQLGLALPSTPPPPSPPIKGFDLNSFVYEARVCSSINDNYKKRSFAQAFADGKNDKTSTPSATAVPRTLPLLLWNKQPNNDGDEEDDDNNPHKRQHCNSRFTVVIK